MMDKIKIETEALIEKIKSNPSYIKCSSDDARKVLLEVIKTTMPIYYNDSYLIEFVRYRIVESGFDEIIQYIYKFEGNCEAYGAAFPFNGSDDIAGKEFTDMLFEARKTYLTEHLEKELSNTKKEEKKGKVKV